MDINLTFAETETVDSTSTQSLFEIVDKLLRITTERKKLLEQAHRTSQELKIPITTRNGLIKRMSEAGISIAEISESLSLAKDAVYRKARSYNPKKSDNPNSNDVKPVFMNIHDEAKPVPKSNLVKKKSPKTNGTTSPPTLIPDSQIHPPDESTCQSFTIPPIPEPDKWSEVITCLRSAFTNKTEWSYLHAYIENFEL